MNRIILRLSLLLAPLSSNLYPSIITSIQSAYEKQKIARSIGNEDELSVEKDIETQCLNDLAAANATSQSTKRHCAKHNHYNIEDDDCILSLYAMGEKDGAQKPESVTVGDHIIGISSSGLHTDGYREVNDIIDQMNIDVSGGSPFITHHANFAQALLEPALSYETALRPLYQEGLIKACAHVAGEGLKRKIEEILPGEFGTQIHFDNWYIPPVFRWVKESSAFSDEDMLRRFNCGLGIVLITSARNAENVINHLEHQGYRACSIGTVTKQTFGSVQVGGTIRSSRIRIMLVGYGATEHALAWKLAQSPYVELVCLSPGNGGTATEHKIKNLPINPTHYGALIAYTQKNSMDMLIVGPDTPLAPQIISQCKQKGIRCLGPTLDQMQKIESVSKNEITKKYHIPVSNRVIEENVGNIPVEVALLMTPEASQFLLTCQIEYPKKCSGVLSPAPCISPPLLEGIKKLFVEPVRKMFANEKIDYSGFLTLRIIKTLQGDLFLSDIRCGLTQWTSQALALSLKSDLVALCNAACERKLDAIDLKWDRRPILGLSLSTEQDNPSSQVIVGMHQNQNAEACVFHNNTSFQQSNYIAHDDDALYAIGIGDTFQQARNNAYAQIKDMYWPGISYRKDIGYKVIAEQKNR